MTPDPEPPTPDAAESRRESAIKAILSAALGLLAASLPHALPPVVNPQFRAALEATREPVVAVVVAVVVVALSAWRWRVLASVAAVVAVTAGLQTAYYVHTTEPGRAARAAAESWTSLDVAPSFAGSTSNEPGVLGRATATWRGDDVRLNLKSTDGTTQQGFVLNAGATTTKYLFSADVVDVDGGVRTYCPLLFGIEDNRNYYTFRLQDFADSGPIAVAYKIIPTGPEIGFTGQALFDTPPGQVSYVERFSVLRPSERRATRLMMQVVGSRYRFYVNDRLVDSRDVTAVPTQAVAVGVTVLKNIAPTDAACKFENVSLKVAS